MLLGQKQAEPIFVDSQHLKNTWTFVYIAILFLTISLSNRINFVILKILFVLINGIQFPVRNVFLDNNV